MEKPGKKAAIIVTDKNLKEILLKGYVAAPKDTFPIQVGAFHNKSYADNYYGMIKKLHGIDARIIFKDGFYNVRITRYPDVEKPEQGSSASYYYMKMIDKRNSGRSDTLLFSSVYNDLPRPEASLSYTPAPVVRDMPASKSRIPWLKRIKYFGESFILIKVLFAAILFFIGTIIILPVIILMNRRMIEKRESLHHSLLEKYQSLIVDYLFGDISSDEFRSIATDSYRRQVLIDQLIDVSLNLKGDESKKLINLYKDLGLSRDSLARANDPRWHKKIKGFRELAFMNNKDANDIIYEALDSSNEILRMEAQIALVRLSDKDPFEFLSHLKRPFSLWEQITLHDLIVQHNIPKPPFKKWLSSPNFTIVLFALRMIREFKQTDAKEEIKKSLLHQSPEVRLLAVEVAGDMGMASTVEIMKRMYKTQDHKICLEILRSMGKIPDISMLGFLKLVLDKEDDVQLQIEATRTIKKIGKEGVDILEKMISNEYKNYNIIVKHVLDRRIN